MKPKPPTPPAPSLIDLAAQYLSMDFSGRAITTIRNNREYLRAFVVFIGPRKIDPYSYQDWVKEIFRRWAPRTAQLALTVSGRFLNWMERYDHIARSPHRIVRAPIIAPPLIRVPFTTDEYERMKSDAKASDPMMHWAIVCGWETGMALVDVADLKWSSVNFQKRMISILRRKTKGACLIPLMEDGECLPLLEEKFFRQRTDWPNKAEEGIFYVDTELEVLYWRRQSEIQLRFNKIRDRAGVDKKKTFHNFRASFCSMLANAGIQTVLACRMSGHKDPKIFAQYITPDLDKLHEQAEIAWKSRAAGIKRLEAVNSASNIVSV